MWTKPQDDILTIDERKYRGYMESKELVAERKKTHGNWKDQARIARRLKDEINSYQKPPGSDNLTLGQREALDMICVKISRIVVGDAQVADHWDDIAGYALLGKQGHD